MARSTPASSGRNASDELNLIEPGGNYGWPIVEGIGNDPRFLDPVQQWRGSDARPSGITVTDAAGANLRGQRLIELPLDDPGTSTAHHVGEFRRLANVVAPYDSL